MRKIFVLPLIVVVCLFVLIPRAFADVSEGDAYCNAHVPWTYNGHTYTGYVVGRNYTTNTHCYAYFFDDSVTINSYSYSVNTPSHAVFKQRSTFRDENNVLQYYDTYALNFGQSTCQDVHMVRVLLNEDGTVYGDYSWQCVTLSQVVMAYREDTSAYQWHKPITAGGNPGLNYLTNTVTSPEPGVAFSGDIKIDDAFQNPTYYKATDSFTPPTVSLTTNLDPSAGGGVVSLPQGDGIYCGVDNYTICQLNFNLNSQVELEAYPNSGYAFAYWDDGTNHYTDNPHTFTMSSAMTVTAVFRPILGWPLSGYEQDRTILLSFGADWSFAQCPTGTDKLHSGIDLNASVNEPVSAAHDGTVKEIYTGEYSQWADAIVIESNDGQFTTVYWHVNPYGNLSVNDTVTKGQQIATVADLSSNTHFHFGVRMSSYDANLSLAGALPQSACGTSPTYPAFPEFFIDPATLTYE